jgi:phosphotransferase system enzyme I (PtsI)
LKSFKQILTEADNKIAGIAAAPGIVIAKVYLYTKEKLKINDGIVTDEDMAITDLHEALKKSKKELNKIFSFAKEKMDPDRAGIFEAQLMILDDPVLINIIVNRIKKEKRQPEYIVNDEISKYQELMRNAHESYMNERASDIEDIKNRIIRNLQKKRWESKIASEMIVVSDLLTPADTILLSRSNVKGFVTDHGGLTSHAAIISRSLNIPAVVGAHNATLKIKDGDTIIVDGFHGYVIINPNEEQIQFFATKVERLIELQKGLEEFKDKPGLTEDGHEIQIMANVDVTGEVDIVISSGAKGIGLYRTEQILEELGEFPGEEEQTIVYSRLSTRIYPDNIIIRAFDIGGDKVKFLDFKEPNPFLGLRGIRLLLENKSMFKTQIRAVLRASKDKNVQFMLPMVTTLTEVRRSKEIIEECKRELKQEKIAYDKHIKIGVMIEVPSAAVMAMEFAMETDFLSIGTNDLIQYLMAVDRGNDLVSDLYQEFHPAVIKTLYHIISEGKNAGKEVSLCGEMAADTLAIPLLIGMGLTSFSISPTVITYAKRIISKISFEKAKVLAEECLNCTTEVEVQHKIEHFFKVNNITRTRNII